MKYIVITSKHHDGFAIYDSKVSDYDIADRTPYKKDPIAELAAETKKAGLKFCFYYSIMDWHHPSQYVNEPGKDRTAGNSKNQMLPDQKAVYVAYMKTQLKELVDKYDPAVLWFDGEWSDWWTEEDGQDLYAYVRGLKPSIIINNRVGKGRKGMEGLNRDDREYSGDFGTPEQQIPANGIPGVDWESCMTLNDTWGFKSVRRELEIDGNARPQPDRHRLEGRQLSAERRSHSPGRDSGGQRRTAPGHGQVDGREQRVDLRHHRQPLQRAAAVRPRDEEGQSPLRAGVRLAVQRHADAAIVGRDAEEGLASRDEGGRACEGVRGGDHAHRTGQRSRSDRDGRGG